MMNKTGIGSHQSHKMLSDEWLTPPEIINSLGEFDLDPCSPIERPWDTAKTHYNVLQDGLNKDWFGRVWLNPPYGKYTKLWLEKMSNHNNGIVLIFARTETKMFFSYVWNNAISILFLEGRLFFYDVKGNKAKSNSGAPSVLISYGYNNSKILENCNLHGKHIYLQNKG